MADAEYERKLNDWHLELHLTADLARHVFDEMLNHDSLPEWMQSSARIVAQRLADHVETLPFPGVDHAR